jgi:hypothetical protein
MPSRDVIELTITSYIADPTTSPTSGLNIDQSIFRSTTRNMTRKSTLKKVVGALKSINTIDLTIIMSEHDTKVECEDWTTEVISSVRAFYVTIIFITSLNND